MSSTPHNIVLIVTFRGYNPRESSKTKHVPNTVRKILAGAQGGSWKYLSLPDEVNKRIGQKAIEPLYFSLIKPSEYGVKKGEDFARGAIEIYGYVGPPSKEFVDKVIVNLINICKELMNKEYLHIASFNVMTARSEAYEY